MASVSLEPQLLQTTNNICFTIDFELVTSMRPVSLLVSLILVIGIVVSVTGTADHGYGHDHHGGYGHDDHHGGYGHGHGIEIT